jgi:hypothetical protein
MTRSSDNTALKQQIGRPFKPGQSGNPKGRPKGARSRVSESLLEELAQHFETKGKAAIDVVFQERPHDYLKIIASLLPKQMEIDDLRPKLKAEDLTDDELAGIIQGANGSGKTHRAGPTFD